MMTPVALHGSFPARARRRTRALPPALPLALLALSSAFGCGDRRAATTDSTRAGRPARSGANAPTRNPLPATRASLGPPRRPLPGRAVLWIRGGSEHDTLLAYAAQAAADSANLYVLDSGRGEIVALHATTGTLAWRRTTPRPPRAIAPLPGGGLAVADADGTIALLDPTGHLTATRTLPPDSPPIRHLCALSPSHLVAATADTSHTLLELRDDSPPHPLPLPWPDAARRHYLVTQTLLASSAHHPSCAVALTLGRGFSLFDGSRFSTPTPYVEPFDLPGITRTRFTDGDRTVTREQLSTDLSAARAIALADGRLIVSFGGNTPLAARVVDVYDAPSGAYLGSFTHPHRISALATHGRNLYVLYQSQGRPAVAALVDTTTTPPTGLTRR